MTDKEHIDKNCSCEETDKIIIEVANILRTLTTQIIDHLENINFKKKAETNDLCTSEILLYLLFTNIQALTIMFHTGDIDSLNKICETSQEFLESHFMPSKNKNITIQ